MVGLNAMTHGHVLGGKESPTYISWKAMKRRCNSPSHRAYRNYGGKGITYCPEWESFVAFLSDMGERPTGASLDRIDSDKDYSRDNCRWATREAQNRNKSTNVINAETAKEIYRRAKSGEIQKRIAEDIGCSVGLVSNIKNGYVWSSVTGAKHVKS